MNRITNIYWISVILISFFACNTNRNLINKKLDYSQKFRPQYHFSPPKGWMNDPNGLVYFDGEYHLFYQHYPDGNTWGPMHWGHAISTDLIHWDNYPIALYPDSLGYIFSGSAVIDWKNSSGFGKNGQPPMVAIYAYHSMEGEKAGKIEIQYQGIAYSNDKGRTWTKYNENPVLKNPGIKDFRDPKVIWHEESKNWIMALAVKDKISFYTSPNLLNWQHSSDFNVSWAAYGDFWECPDLFPIKSALGITKWVLLVSINPGGPNGGSATQYFVGDFDGKKFVTETTQTKWLDYGADNYAGVTWSDIPNSDGRRLFMGWMSNWLYAQKVPTEIWRSAMTVPRVLTLKQTNGDYTLLSNPIQDLNNLRLNSKRVPSNRMALLSDNVEIEMELGETDFQLIFSNKNNEKVVLKKENNQITFDRSQSGITDFNTDFIKVHKAPLQNILLKNVKVYIDRSSMEFIFNDGELNITELVFPQSPYTILETKGVKGSSTIHQLSSIWGN